MSVGAGAGVCLSGLALSRRRGGGSGSELRSGDGSMTVEEGRREDDEALFAGAGLARIVLEDEAPEEENEATGAGDGGVAGPGVEALDL